MRAPRLTGLLIGLIAGLMVSGCQQQSPQLVKIGLVAPFEGRYREIGIDVIPAARLAIREWAAQHPNEDIAIELVAYDDAGNPAQAVEQANKLIADPAVEVVVGHWREDTTAAVSEVYSEAGISLIAYAESDLPFDGAVYNLAPAWSSIESSVQGWIDQQTDELIWFPNMDISITEVTQRLEQDLDQYIGSSGWGMSQFYSLTDGAADGSYFVSGYAMPSDSVGSFWIAENKQLFVDGFQAGSLGAPPGLFSAAAYEATWVALDLIAEAHGIHTETSPTRSIEFRDDGRRIDAPLYLYQWVDGVRELIAVLD